ncbi:MAG: recombinase family protein [Planctomycetota bacterium]
MSPPLRKRTDIKRCAIYTRKSHEEGLDQAFNSLDAQREAGVDYVKSQRHEGWEVIDKQYDDGGFTGGNMDRPGLKELLQDIERGAVDVVVVYKVDRLSRSLHDFAQIMQRFDEQEVSFVSVTQQFNTTTSMGRLTLNMLLSFAQFEREVTGERIRDKLAATKKKGLWVTGQPPLGYRTVEKELVAIPEEADLVRRVFEGYLEQPSLIELAARLNHSGGTTKRWLSSRDRWHGGKPMTPKYLYRVLTNPLYIGKITHKDKVWPGQHKPIIPRKLWDQVQQAIDKREKQTRHRWDHPHLLKGKLKTFEDATMSPGAVHRPSKTKGEKRLVCYYVSQKAVQKGYKHCPIKTINATHIDNLVRALVLDHLDGESLEHLRHRDCESRDYWVREIIDRVVLGPDQMIIELNDDRIEACREFD